MSQIHDLARRYNEALAGRDPARADEIEWTVDRGGNLKLRDIPEWSAARTVSLDRRSETARQRWVDDHKMANRPFAETEPG